MSSSGTVPPSPVLPFSQQQQQFQSNNSSPLSNFFSTSNNGNPFSIGCLNDPSNLQKAKRGRQRVDAGEPRNNYQGALMNHLKDPMIVDQQNENTDQEDNESVNQQTEENELLLSADNDQQPSDFELSDEEENQQKLSNASPINLSAICPPPTLSSELPTLIKNDPTENRHSNNSAMSSSSSKRKRFQPQKQPMKLDPPTIELNDDEEFEEKFAIPEQISNESEKDTNEPPSNVMESLRKELANRANSSNQQGVFSGLAAQLNNGQSQSNFFANKMFMEMQRRMYATALSQQRSQQNGRNEEEDSAGIRDAVMKDFTRFVQNFNENFMAAIQKMSSDFTPIETEKAIVQQVKQQKEQKQLPEWRSPQSFGIPNAGNLASINPLFNPMNLPFANQRNLMSMAAANQNPLHSIANSISQQNTSTVSTNANSLLFPNLSNNNKLANTNSGIFPTPIPNFPAFNGFPPNHASNLSRNDDGSPRKKRSKVTDSVRGPRSAVRDNGHSLPASSRSSPQPNGYFPPTMVPHPLYNNTSFRMDRTSQSPRNSEDFSDYGLDGSPSQSATLTHVHLRKAKLMFFYTRYPSSSVLKSYFPDIHFTKSNTAQLVKWFSNFREFYYMQMEKFAKQAIAEGITDALEIKVTSESEIYKQLNQHYNRNNFINPPETLAHVIEETLKEFFRALQEGRDAEPSWKKAIYKVIQQMDETIPECFKSPNFMIQLEGNQSN